MVCRSIISLDFFDDDPLKIARNLLGQWFFTKKRGVVTGGRIVEVEAYLGIGEDPASHAFRKMTTRNKAMFGPPGHLYVYRSYGIHTCVNLVTKQTGVASAVLIRALEPLVGLPAMAKRRKTSSLYNLASGPGKVTQALSIDITDNEKPLKENWIWIEKGNPESGDQIVSCTRVGIRKGSDLPFRWMIANSKFISKKLRT